MAEFLLTRDSGLGELPTPVSLNRYTYGFAEELIADGAKGVVDKDDPPELLAAALRCVSGGMYISRHAHISSVGPVRLELADDDRVLLEMLVDGRSVIAIASKRGYSRSSMHARMKDVYDEIGVSNRSQAIAWVARSDITTMAPRPPASRG